jgi:hypothetical protein
LNRNYIKGRRNEYRSMAFLEGAGYHCIRAAGSRGLFDIWAVSATDFILCQVKSGDARLTTPDLTLIKALPVPTNCRKVVHIWRPRQKLPTIYEV